MTVSINRLTCEPSLDHSTADLEQVLQDIVDHITIQADFTITHSKYEAVKLPSELQQRFSKLSNKVRYNYLETKLQQFLYRNYYQIETGSKLTEENYQLENQAIKWSDSDFLAKLRRNNHSDGHFELGWLIVGETEAGFLQVKKNGLTLHIRRDRHLPREEESAKVGDTVSVKMPPQLVEPGYYISVGTVGTIKDLELQPDNPIVNVYLNLTSLGALELMDSLTTELNAIAIPFQFKVLYRPEEYTYCNSATLSFAKSEFECVKTIIETAYRQYKAYFKLETLLFTKYLAPGLSIAEQPLANVDLAQDRCQMIAQALITAWQQDKAFPADRLECIRDRFWQANISLERPYLNPNSQDIYHRF
ncbi:MAG: T3SS effector HopA1 family protein [Pleurocapsa sp.]